MYQKTFNVPNFSATINEGGLYYGSIDLTSYISDYDMVFPINDYCFLTLSTNTVRFPVFVEFESGTNIDVFMSSSRTNTTATITLQYTKTTDQANSFNFGNTTDYSTDEKIVGTWIDGSYIYQITYNLDVSLGNSGTLNRITLNGLSQLNIDYLINSIATIKGYTSTYVGWFCNNNGLIDVSVYTPDNELDIIQRQTGGGVLKITSITLQYTKTT